jgi:hypothetical protein
MRIETAIIRLPALCHYTKHTQYHCVVSQKLRQLVESNLPFSAKRRRLSQLVESILPFSAKRRRLSQLVESILP